MSSAPSSSVQKLLDTAAETDAVNFVAVDDSGAYQGLVTADDINTALLQPEAVPLLVVGELLRSHIPTVHRSETLDTILDKFARGDVPVLAISADNDPTRVEGLISRQALLYSLT